MTSPDRARLPDLSLPAIGCGPGAPLRARRQGTVLVLLARPLAQRDLEYARELAAHERELREWDGRALVVLEGAESAPASTGAALEALQLPIPIVADAGSRVAAAAGVVAPAVVVADQWGEVHAAAPASGGAGWLPLDEIVAWLKYMSIRCAG